MGKRCYYEILGVARGSNPDEVKSAFRKLAKECHPDRNPGDESAEHRFKELNEAYDVLKDDDKRAAYDRYGHGAFEQGGGRAGFEAGGFGNFADVFEDIFGEFMGGTGPGGTRRGTRSRGADVPYNIEITLEEAFKGKPATLTVQGAVPCEPCGGSGAEAGTKPQTCQTCSGLGRVRAQQGFFTIERTCPHCMGQGRIVKTPCKACNGQGRQTKERQLAVTIPAGVEDGTRMRLTGEGEPAPRGGAPGDLYIFVSVKPHALFQRDGADLHCRVPISLSAAALGGAIEVPTLDGGRAKVNVPEGTQTGRQFRLRSKGMPQLRGGHAGDLYIHCVVETPVHLTRRQKELLREFEEAGSEANNPESTSFFQRVASFFDSAKG
jgi:molecular chaperone DnaJ